MDPDVRRDSGALRRRRSSTSRINVIGISDTMKCKMYLAGDDIWRNAKPIVPDINNDGIIIEHD